MKALHSETLCGGPCQRCDVPRGNPYNTRSASGVALEDLNLINVTVVGAEPERVIDARGIRKVTIGVLRELRHTKSQTDMTLSEAAECKEK